MSDNFNRVPIRNDLLENIGRVGWLAIRLHFQVRDRCNLLTGTDDKDKIFDVPLGVAISNLLDAATSDGNQELVDWCENKAKPAKELRNGLVHAVAITSADGQQSLKGTERNGKIEYTAEEIDKISEALADAITSMP